MDVYPDIFVGTDGSPAAEQAVLVAAGLARSLDVPLSVVSAWTESGPDAYLRAASLTTGAEAVAREHGVGEVRRLEPGEPGAPADSLIDLTQASGQSLLVIGDRGLDSAGERFGGNTAHQLTHHSPVDLLLAVAGRSPALRRIATTTDGSPTAGRAVYRGVALAQALGVVPHILTVAKSQAEGDAALEIVTDDLDRRGIEVSRQVLVAPGIGQVTHTLVEASADYDLLVIGNRGMSGPSRLLGSVSNRVTHDLSTNLLLVRTVG